MRSNPARTFLVPGVVLAAASAVTFAPAVVVPVAPNTQPPTVHVAVEQIALTGIGQDIYYAITPAVQYAVGGVSYLINFIPIIGAPTAAQVNINYYQAIQPVVEATVNYLAAVVQNPLDLIGATAAYGATLYDIGYNWVSAEAVFFGFPPLPPLPPAPPTAAGVKPDRFPARTAAPTARPEKPARGGSKHAAATAAAVATPAADAGPDAGADAGPDTGPGAKKARAEAAMSRRGAR